MAYPRLPIEEFGRQLIETGDLDPLYVALKNASWKWPCERRIKRWLLAYWVFYHAGVASYISDASDNAGYWARWLVAARNESLSPTGGRWPRGQERRHMRGMAAEACWSHLSKEFQDNPEAFCDEVKDVSCRRVIKRVRKHVQFGPWIGFKVADMLERVLGYSIDFERSTVFFFKDPTKAATMWAGEERHAWLKEDVVALVSDYLINEFSDLKAPPSADRPIGLQEVETVLCKWKSHRNGHYPVGYDTTEIRNGLREWSPYSGTANELYQAMP